MGITALIVQVAQRVPYPPLPPLPPFWGLAMMLWAIVYIILVIFPLWKIFSKAGFPGWLSLPAILPPIYIIMLFFLAFAEWPALTKKDTGQPEELP